MANSDCKNILDLIPLYIDNMLSEEETDIARKHLDFCENCRKEFNFMQSLTKTTKNLPEIDVPADFHNKLMSQINAKKAKHYLMLKRVSTVAAAAAVIALSVVAVSNFDITQNATHLDQYITDTNVSDSPVSMDSPDEKNDKTDNVTEIAEQSFNAAEPAKSETTESFSGGGSAAANVKTNDLNAPASISLDEESNFKTATIILNDDNKNAALEILSSYEKDEIGYIVADIDSVTRKLSELGIDVAVEIDIDSTTNHIIVK